jgi:glycogen operon protein
VAGSPDLYWTRGVTASVNFITCHDGFTLRDLVSYNGKHNDANGEHNQDGSNDNDSWNCGAEGPTDDAGVNALRRRQIKNAAALLLTSQGIPMILMGDEVGRTQRGNNNTYCHDNDLNWFDWWLVEENADLLRFFRHLTAFRHAHPALRRRDHFRYADVLGSGLPDISFHGVEPWRPDFSGTSRTLAWMLCGRHAKGGLVQDNDLYVAANAWWDGLEFCLPELPQGRRWHVAVNTGVEAPNDIQPLGQEPVVADPQRFVVGGRSVVILVGR